MYSIFDIVHLQICSCTKYWWATPQAYVAAFEGFSNEHCTTPMTHIDYWVPKLLSSNGRLMEVGIDAWYNKPYFCDVDSSTATYLCESYISNNAFRNSRQLRLVRYSVCLLLG